MKQLILSDQSYLYLYSFFNYFDVHNNWDDNFNGGFMIILEEIGGQKMYDRQ